MEIDRKEARSRCIVRNTISLLFLAIVNKSIFLISLMSRLYTKPCATRLPREIDSRQRLYSAFAADELRSWTPLCVSDSTLSTAADVRYRVAGRWHVVVSVLQKQLVSFEKSTSQCGFHAHANWARNSSSSLSAHSAPFGQFKSIKS